MNRRSAPALAAFVIAAVVASCTSAGDGESAPADAGTTAAEAPTTAPEPSTTPTEPDTGAGAPPAASEGCGAAAPAITSGVATQTLTSGGVERTYRRYLPPGYDGTTPVPLVLNFHGLTSNAEQQTVASGLEELAGTEGFVVVAPQGLGDIPFWNALRAPGAPDDVAFTSELLDALERDLCLDRSRVYTTGMSNGGLMSSLLACDLADRIAAAAPVSGLLYPAPCDAGRAVPLAVFYGAADQVLPPSGGLGESVQSILESRDLIEGSGDTQQEFLAEYAFAPIDESLSAWTDRETCDATPTEQDAADDVLLRTWRGCEGGAEIRLYLVEGGGHTWPGSSVMAAIESSPVGETIGHTTMNISASETMWEFFSGYSLPRPGA